MPQRRPYRAPRDHVRLLLLAPAILISAMIFLALNYGLNGLLGMVDKAPIRENLRQAFESGALGIVDSRTDDRDMGVHQTNDCLIFDMASRDRSDPALYLFAAARTQVVRDLPVGNCEALRDWLMNDPLETYKENWYLRYIHGYRAVAIGLLEFLSVEHARDAMKGASYGIFLLAILVNLGFLAMRPPQARLFSRNQVGYSIISGTVLLFFGLPYFGQSISHAPALVTLGGFILGWSVLDGLGRLTERSALALIIPFGLFTAYFEFLTGYIPVGTCIIAALVAVGWSDRPNAKAWPIIRMLALGEATFVASIASVFVLHVLATAVMTPLGSQSISLFISRLAFRMSTSTETAAGVAPNNASLTLFDVALALLKQIRHLGYVSERSGVAVLALSLGACLFGALDIASSRRAWPAKVAVLIAAGSFVPVGAWIFLFQNHTAIHASFMVRLLVAIPVAGALTTWMWFRSVTEGHSLAAMLPWIGRRRAVATAERTSG